MRASITRLLAPLAWRDPARAGATLLRFARAERSSMLELQLAAERTSSPALAALYLGHAADERRHARMFAARAAKLGSQDVASVFHADEHALFETFGEVGFLAFVNHGERRGVRQLGAYREHFARRGDDVMRALLDRVLEDEHRHVAYTRLELERLTGSAAATRRALALAALRDAKLLYLRLARRLSSRVFRASMVLMYFAVLPLVVIGRVLSGRGPAR